MPSLLEKARRAAFHHQGGLCLYCDLPVWLDDSDAFRSRYSDADAAVLLNLACCCLMSRTTRFTHAFW